MANREVPTVGTCGECGQRRLTVTTQGEEYCSQCLADVPVSERPEGYEGL